MDAILKRDLLSNMDDKEIMQKHKIPNYRTLRRLFMFAKGIHLEGGTYGNK